MPELTEVVPNVITNLIELICSRFQQQDFLQTIPYTVKTAHCMMPLLSRMIVGKSWERQWIQHTRDDMLADVCSLEPLPW